jgi:hypothetical protein
MKDDERTVALVFKPEEGSDCDLAIVLMAPSEIEALLTNPIRGRTDVPSDTIVFQRRPIGGPQPLEAEPEPPIVTIPGTVAIQGDRYPFERTMIGVLADGRVTFGGEDSTGDFARTPPMSPEVLRPAVEPYPVGQVEAEQWRKVAASDPQRAAVLLRPASNEPLALDPEDLAVLLSSGDSAVREIAQAALGRTRRRGRPTQE